jgi:hypothetical protein
MVFCRTDYEDRPHEQALSTNYNFVDILCAVERCIRLVR